jgi:hypothetical protein
LGDAPFFIAVIEKRLDPGIVYSAYVELLPGI